MARSGALRASISRKGGPSHENNDSAPLRRARAIVRRPVHGLADRKFDADQVHRTARGEVARTQAPADEEMIVTGQRRWQYRPLRCWLAAFFIVAGPSLAAGQPTPQSTLKLVGTGAIGPTEQGWSVALSADGTTAIVGGIVDNGLAGAAWVYTRSDGGWTQQGSKLVGTGAVGQGGQGVSVALSADSSTAIVGGPYDNKRTGAAWVYTRCQYRGRHLDRFFCPLRRVLVAHRRGAWD